MGQTRAAVAVTARALIGWSLRLVRLLDQAQERLGEVVGVGRVAELVGRSSGEDAALTQEQQLVAVAGLVHDVARDEQRGSCVGELVEGGPEMPAQQGVEADGGFVEDEHRGVPTSAVASEARACSPPESVRTTWSASGSSCTAASVSSTRPAGAPRMRAK